MEKTLSSSDVQRLLIKKIDKTKRDDQRTILEFFETIFGDYTYGPTDDHNYLATCKPNYTRRQIEHDLLRVDGEGKYEDGIFGAMQYLNQQIDEHENDIGLYELQRPDYFINLLAFYKARQVFKNAVADSLTIGIMSKATAENLADLKYTLTRHLKEN